MKIKLEHTHYMPKKLKPGVLYVSREFKAAAHLCACGCGVKIRTPLTPTEWSLEETDNGPTLHPSVGNWQQACKSHYYIYQGKVKWAAKWTPVQIAAGRRKEEDRRHNYYSGLENQRGGVLRSFWTWFTGLLSR